MLRVAICDDASAVCAELENIILKFQKQNNEELTVDIFYSGEKLISL